MRHLRARMIGSLLLSLVASITSAESNFLEVIFDRHTGGGEVSKYDVILAANKVGASTCGVTTPNGTYVFEDVGEEFWPGQDFVDDHWDLTFAELVSVLLSDWTLIWDEGLGTVTSLTINYGTLEESEFLPVPTITLPLNGATNVDPSTNVEWTYDPTDPCTAQQGDPAVCLERPSETPNYDPDCDELSGCETTSWTPTSELTDGDWIAMVFNPVDIRDVPDGLTITGNPWVLGNSEWLALRSTDSAQFYVGTPPAVRTMSFGALKALYR